MAEIVSRKVQIEGVATELFRKKGYAATSMRDLAQAVGMEAASIYSHIKNKEALLSSICFRLADAFMDAKKEMELQTMPAPQLLQKAIEAHVRVITNNLDASAVFLHEWRHLSPEPLAEFIALRKAYENYLIRIIQQGKEEGKFHLPYINSKYWFPAIVFAVYGFLIYKYPEFFKSQFQITSENIETALPMLIFFAVCIIMVVLSYIKEFSLIPVLGLVSCCYLLTGMAWSNWKWFFVWLVIGLIFYFSYGRKHSKLNKA